MTEIIWNTSRTVYTSVMVILTYKADIKGHVTNGSRKKCTGKNSTKSSNGSQFKFWQIYNWLWNVLLKKFIAPEQINMSFAFFYIKCQAKQFSTQWNLLLLFFPSVFLSFSVFHSGLNFIDRISWLSVLVLKRSILKVFRIPEWNLIKHKPLLNTNYIA